MFTDAVSVALVVPLVGDTLSQLPVEEAAAVKLRVPAVLATEMDCEAGLAPAT